jgi:hypothetical protein
MSAKRPLPIGSRLRALVTGLLAAGLLAGALAACAGPGSQQDADDHESCGGLPCDNPAYLARQVRLDTDAILAGMAHARAHLGLQEDAAP